jgi:hypothetical protein
MLVLKRTSDLIVDELGHLRELLGDQEDTGATPVEALGLILKEFESNNLCFGYNVKGVRWIVFDKPNELRRTFKTTQDNETPAPPEPNYTDWLKSIHDDEWVDFHASSLEDPDLHEKRSRAGKAGAEARWNGKSMAGNATSHNLLDGNGKNGTGVRGLVLGIESKYERSDTQPSEQEAQALPTDNAQTLCELISTYSGNAVKPDWRKYALSILKATPLDKLKPLLEWMYVESDFWGQRTFSTKNLFDHLQEGNLLKKYNAVRILEKKKAAKLKPSTTAPGAHGNKSGMEF